MRTYNQQELEDMVDYAKTQAFRWGIVAGVIAAAVLLWISTLIRWAKDWIL